MTERAKTFTTEPIPPRKKPRERVSPKVWERPEFPPKRAWPRFSFSEQEMILAFLGDWAEHAAAALAVAETHLKLAPDLPSAEGQRRYWANVLSAIAWLSSQVSARQRHLAVAKFFKLHPESEQWQPSPGR